MSNTRALTMRISQDALDDHRFPLGLIRLGRDHTVTHLNRAVREMVGGQLEVGMAITSLNLDEPSRESMRKALADRARGAGTAYDIALENKTAGTIVRASIAAVPEYNADGEISGSVGFVRDETIEIAATAIYREMEQAKVPELLLAGLMRELRLVLKFDALLVTLIGQDGKHLRLFYDSDPVDSASTFRWWPMPSYVKKMLDDFQPRLDFEAFYESEAKHNPDIAHFWERGFRYPCQLKVKHRGVMVAIVSIWRRKGGKPFTEDDQQAFERLPVREAVRFAHTLDMQRHQRFAAIVVHRAMRKGRDATAIGQRLVDDLWAHFRWEHVSLFHHAEERGKLRLVCQAKEGEMQLPPTYEQGVGVGLLGECVKSSRPVNSGDVAQRKGNVFAIKDAKSELVLPLPGAKVRWLLNIETKMGNAFALEEERFLAGLLKFVAFLLEGAAGAELHDTIMSSVGDLIIQTDDHNNVRDVSASCTALLDRAREDMIGRNLGTFVEVQAPPDAAAGKPPGGTDPWATSETDVGTFDAQSSSVLHSAFRTSEVARFKRPDGSKIAMLVSVAPNAGMFGGKVFVGSDVSSKQFVDRVERIGSIIGQLSSEIRIPLALAAQLLKHEGKDNDRLNKARAQIDKVDISIERIVKAASRVDDAALELERFDIREAVRSAVAELPADDRNILSIRLPKKPVMIHAAPAELRSCVHSILTHLLQQCADDERISLDARQEGDEALLELGLQTSAGDTVECLPPAKADGSMMFEVVVPSLMGRMKGRFLPAGVGEPSHRLLVPME